MQLTTERKNEIISELIAHEVEAAQAEYEALKISQIQRAQEDSRNLSGVSYIRAHEQATANAKRLNDIELYDALQAIAAKYGGMQKVATAVMVQKECASRDMDSARAAGDWETMEKCKKRAERLDVALSKLVAGPVVERSDVDERRSTWLQQGGWN